MGNENLAEKCRLRGCSSAVTSRILRLNPTPKMGEHIRGWHPHKSRSDFIHIHVISLGDFCKLHPVAEWRAYPRSAFVFSGKRKYLMASALFSPPTPTMENE
jgi:hypothetical protein